MATFRKRGARWQAIVARGGVAKSATFDTKVQAQAWAAGIEADVLAARRGEIPPSKTFSDLLARYRDEASVKKRGARWEQTRIDMIIRDDPLADVRLVNLSARDAAAWRDRRLSQVSAGSVLREWNILSAACTRAIREWHWLHTNPFKEIDRPAQPQARTRRPIGDEIQRILLALGCDPQTTPTTASARAGFAVLFAVETAMRAGEILGLTWADITLPVAHLAQTKNGHARDVPLTVEARRLLTLLPRGGEADRVFGLESATLDALFRRACRRAQIEDLHFHDLRREALTRLSGRVDVMTLAKISGHRDLRILQNTYYAPRMHEVADLLG